METVRGNRHFDPRGCCGGVLERVNIILLQKIFIDPRRILLKIKTACRNPFILPGSVDFNIFIILFTKRPLQFYFTPFPYVFIAQIPTNQL